MQTKPIKLLTYNRLDVIFKILYLKYLDLNAKKLSSDLYFSHIKIITNGLFVENNSNKKTYDDFLFEFKKVSNSIRENGFDSEISEIPISKDGSIINGAHRLASAIYYKVPFISIKKTNENKHVYDYNFFRVRGMSNNLIELAILEFISLTKNNFLAIIWPSADKSIHYINEFSNILYQKKIILNAKGAQNFVAQVYKEHKWLGDFSDGYSGAYTKVSQAFSSFSEIHLIFFKEKSLEKVNKIKISLREKFNIDKASIHITDNNNETYDLAKLILNDNSIHFLNNAIPYKFQDLFNNLKKLRVYLTSLNISPDQLLISYDSVLSLFGLKNSLTLYVSTNNEILLKEINKSNYLSLFEPTISLEDSLYNPSNFFYYNDFKFQALQNTLKSKEKLKNETSKREIVLINRILSKNHSRVIKLKNLYLKYKYSTVAFLIPFTKKIKVYNLAKWLYKKIN
ncbi:MAG: hypothetical protein ACJ0PP_02155 [Flavobacteriaceae bacterium]